jgi:hypothetical protein
MTTTGKNRIMIFGPKNDGTYVIEFRTDAGAASPVGTPWMWTLLFDYHEDRTPTHGYEPTREAAMAAFAKSWRRE